MPFVSTTNISERSISAYTIKQLYIDENDDIWFDLNAILPDVCLFQLIETYCLFLD